MATLMERFAGEDGRRRLVEALRKQRLVGNHDALAEEIAGACTIEECSTGTPLLTEGAADNHLVFILAGQTSVTIRGREVNRRGPGDHVGEMAALDPAERRSASVIALSDVVFASLSEPTFARIAEKYPRMLKAIAIELAQRLRQRTDLISHRRDKPTLFIGSSVEGLSVAQGIQAALRHDQVTVAIWTDGVFRATQAAIESLEIAVRSTDFAALVLSPDDKVSVRGEEHTAPRDNIVFELGLFMGALGRERTFVIRPRGLPLKLPTDLLGINDIQYACGAADDLEARLGPVATDIRGTMKKLGAR